VCGACARTKQTQLVPDVHSFPGHIACSGTTLSEVVVPVLGDEGQLMAVFDVDSNHPAAFTQTDADELESLFRSFVSRQVYLSGTDNVGSTVE
jgi:L-methionine (R)-S-oxide reductase